MCQQRGQPLLTAAREDKGMRVFVTGATGFIGTELVKELVAASHQVRGLSRSDAGMGQLTAAGAEAVRGDLKNIDGLRRGAEGMDAVVHLAFNHDDMSKFAESGADERAAVEAMGAALKPGKLLVVTSGTRIAATGAERLLTEADPPNRYLPRNPEDAARIVSERGVRVAVVRLPQVHDTRKQGLVTYLIQTAREKGVSAYVGEGANRWPAASLSDAAHLYRLVVESTVPGFHVYHAVEEEGVALRDIAEAIGKGLSLPTKSLSQEEAGAHFGWLGHFAGLDMPASSAETRAALKWQPAGPSMLEDLSRMNYSAR